MIESYRGHVDACEAALREALVIYARTLGSDHEKWAEVAADLAEVLRGRRDDEARDLASRALHVYLERFGEASPQHYFASLVLGRIEVDAEHWQAAMDHFDRALSVDTPEAEKARNRADVRFLASIALSHLDPASPRVANRIGSPGAARRS